MTLSQYKSTELGLSYWLKYAWLSTGVWCYTPEYNLKLACSLWLCHQFASLHHSQTCDGSQWIIFTQADVSAFINPGWTLPPSKLGQLTGWTPWCERIFLPLLLQPPDRGGPATRPPNKNEQKKGADIVLHLTMDALHAVSYFDYCYPQ